MKRFIRLSGILACLLVCSVLAMAVFAVGSEEAASYSSPVMTNNRNDQGYMYGRWARTVNSYLVENDDGTYTRVEYTGYDVSVELYDREMVFVEGRSIAAELPIFGGFYAGEDSNFLIFGQNDPNEDDDVEVIRVVRYTKDWERVDAASLRGANTTVPFDAGSLRCAEYEGYLYIRTAHERYSSSDGYNHQANLTMNVRIGDMTVTDAFYDVMNISYGYVSHSFNQFIAVDDGTLVAVDHGDAYPRSVVLIKYSARAGQDRFLVSGDDGKYVEAVDVLPIAGEIGDNDTGVAVGGFEFSDTAYLVAGNTVSQGAGYDPYGQRNIFVTATSKRDFSENGTKIHYLTSYTEGDEVALSVPQFVKVEDDRFLVLWTESDGDGERLCYVYVDGTGSAVSQIYRAKGSLSDCKPIVSDGKALWYVTNGDHLTFFAIDVKTNALTADEHLSAPSVPSIEYCYSKQQTSVRVKWTNAGDADGYQLWRTTDPQRDDSWICVKTVTNGATTSYTNQGLTEGVTYYYKVRAFVEGEAGRVWSDFSDVDYMPATVVFDGPYSNSTSRIRLRWDEIDGAHGYQIWRKDANGSYRVAKTIGDKGNVLTQDMGGTTAYSNTGLTAGERYTYKMRAFRIAEDGRKIYGAYSDEFTVAVMPETPDVTVTSPKAERAKLVWDPVNGAAGYQIWMSDPQSGGFRIAKSIYDGNADGASIYGLESGKTYHFKVRAYVEVDGKKTFGAYTQTIAVTIQ